MGIIELNNLAGCLTPVEHPPADIATLRYTEAAKGHRHPGRNILNELTRMEVADQGSISRVSTYHGTMAPRWNYLPSFL